MAIAIGASIPAHSQQGDDRLRRRHRSRVRNGSLDLLAAGSFIVFFVLALRSSWDKACYSARLLTEILLCQLIISACASPKRSSTRDSNPRLPRWISARLSLRLPSIPNLSFALRSLLLSLCPIAHTAEDHELIDDHYNVLRRRNAIDKCFIRFHTFYRFLLSKNQNYVCDGSSEDLHRSTTALTVGTGTNRAFPTIPAEFPKRIRCGYEWPQTTSIQTKSTRAAQETQISTTNRSRFLWRVLRPTIIGLNWARYGEGYFPKLAPNCSVNWVCDRLHNVGSFCWDPVLVRCLSIV